MTNSMIKRNNDMFPPLFGWGAIDRLFDEFNRGDLFEHPQGYPTDVIEVKNDQGTVIGYEIDVTLAGIPRENIEVLVENDAINIAVKKTDKELDKNRNYLRRGISQRSMQIRYGLHGIDKDNIKAQLIDGMLKIELPLAAESQSKLITIG